MPLRKPADPKPLISNVTPPAAIAGGELQIRGKGFAQEERPRVTIGEVGAPVIIGSDSFVIARVPEGATAGELVIGSGALTSESWACDIGMLVADSLHPVTNPAVDSFGNIFGHAQDFAGNWHTVEWSVVPEPSGLSLAVLIALGLRRRRSITGA